MADAAENTLVPDVGGLTVLTMENEVIKLESLWRNRRMVLTFLRHFG